MAHLLGLSDVLAPNTINPIAMFPLSLSVKSEGKVNTCVFDPKADASGAPSPLRPSVTSPDVALAEVLVEVIVQEINSDV